MEPCTKLHRRLEAPRMNGFELCEKSRLCFCSSAFSSLCLRMVDLDTHIPGHLPGGGAWGALRPACGPADPAACCLRCKPRADRCLPAGLEGTGGRGSLHTPAPLPLSLIAATHRHLRCTLLFAPHPTTRRRSAPSSEHHKDAMTQGNCCP